MKFGRERTRIQVSKCFEIDGMSDSDVEYASEEQEESIEYTSETGKAEAE